MIQIKTPNVCVFESALYRTTSTVILTADLVLVVDPNWLPNEIQQITNLVATLRGERPLYLLFTHSDYDHIIGYRAFPGATVIASQAFIDNPERESNLKQILKFDDKYYINRSYPIEYPTVDFIIQQDEQELMIGDTLLTFYLAPGHNSDGIFTIVEFDNQRVWVAGDYLSNVEFPFIYHSSYDYEQTLAKAEKIINESNIDFLIPGHGDATMDEADIINRIQDSYAYIHLLRETLRAGKDFPTDQLWQRYHFRGVQQKYQDANVALVKKELGIEH